LSPVTSRPGIQPEQAVAKVHDAFAGRGQRGELTKNKIIPSANPVARPLGLGYNALIPACGKNL
jgi:hypothetical protein